MQQLEDALSNYLPFNFYLYRSDRTFRKIEHKNITSAQVFCGNMRDNTKTVITDNRNEVLKNKKTRPNLCHAICMAHANTY